MLGYCDLLSWPSIEMNTIWEPLVKRKKCDMNWDKKSDMIVERLMETLGL